MAKPKVTAVEVGNWLAIALKFLGLAAQVAAEVAPAMGAGTKAQENIAKAAAAGAAADKLATAAQGLIPPATADKK